MSDKLRDIHKRWFAAKVAFRRAVLAQDHHAITEAVHLCDSIEAEEKAEVEAVRRRVATPAESRSLPGHCPRCERMLGNAEVQRGLCDACAKQAGDVKSQQTCQRCGELMLAEGFCIDCPEKHVGFVCETPGCSNRGRHLHSSVTMAAWLQADTSTRRLAPGERCTDCEAILADYEGPNPEGLHEWYDGGRHVCQDDTRRDSDEGVGRE